MIGRWIRAVTQLCASRCVSVFEVRAETSIGCRPINEIPCLTHNQPEATDLEQKAKTHSLSAACSQLDATRSGDGYPPASARSLSTLRSSLFGCGRMTCLISL
jgi:hypothetical protein